MCRLALNIKNTIWKNLMTIRLWRHLSLVRKKNRTVAGGFTLMELLVSIIVASLVVSGLLYLVNEVIRIDRREAKLENVQRDMQRAADYITDELREAVYVYTDPTVITSQLTASDLPSGGTGAVPILAFWKPEFLTAAESSTMESFNCSSITPAPPDDEAGECDALKLRQSYYSLVVYFTLGNTAADNNNNWKGQARIIRYSLPQYKKSVIGTTGQQTTPGYTDPANDFINWAPEAGVNTDGVSSVLVDYVDSPTSVQGALIATPTAATATGCEEFGVGYQRVPAVVPTATSPAPIPPSNSFMACISQPGNSATGSNQEVVVLLRGSARTSAQAISAPVTVASANQSALPVLKSRVLVRGAANKNPNGN